MAYKKAERFTAEVTKMTENGAVKTGKKNIYTYSGKNLFRNIRVKTNGNLGKKTSGGKGG